MRQAMFVEPCRHTSSLTGWAWGSAPFRIVNDVVVQWNYSNNVAQIIGIVDSAVAWQATVKTFHFF